MKNLKLVFAVLFSVVLCSCSKKDEPAFSSNELDISYLISKYGNVDYSKLDVITMSTSSIHGKVSQIDIRTQYAENNISSNAHRVSFDGSKINSTNQHFPAEKAEKLLPTFGRNVKFKKTELLDGKLVEKEYEIYNPKLIPVTNKGDVENFYNEKDLVIKWSPDKINNKPIHIILILRAMGKERTLPPRNRTNYISKIVSDTGIFKISLQELKIFPDDSRVDVYISRGNQKIVGKTAVRCFNTDLVTSIVH